MPFATSSGAFILQIRSLALTPYALRQARQRTFSPAHGSAPAERFLTGDDLHNRFLDIPHPYVRTPSVDRVDHSLMIAPIDSL